MAKYYDENGTEVEAFSKEELEAKQKEALDEYIAKNPDKTKDLEEATKKVADLTKQLENGDVNEGQKQRLLKEKKDAEDALKNIETKTLGEIKTLKDTIFSGIKNKTLSSLSKGDKEISEKINNRYQSLMKTGDYTEDEEGIIKAMTDAATLVTGNKPSQNFMDNMASGAGAKGEGGGYGGGANEETDNSRNIRKALGISDADAKKFAPKTN